MSRKIPYLGEFIVFSKMFFQIIKNVFDYADFSREKIFRSAHTSKQGANVNFYTYWKNGSVHPDKAGNRGVFWCKHRYNQDVRDR